jgi:hypothetical protein
MRTSVGKRAQIKISVIVVSGFVCILSAVMSTTPLITEMASMRPEIEFTKNLYVAKIESNMISTVR